MAKRPIKICNWQPHSGGGIQFRVQSRVSFGNARALEGLQIPPMSETFETPTGESAFPSESVGPIEGIEEIPQ